MNRQRRSRVILASALLSVIAWLIYIFELLSGPDTFWDFLNQRLVPQWELSRIETVLMLIVHAATVYAMAGSTKILVDWDKVRGRRNNGRPWWAQQFAKEIYLPQILFFAGFCGVACVGLISLTFHWYPARQINYMILPYPVCIVVALLISMIIVVRYGREQTDNSIPMNPTEFEEKRA